ncbi:hypothetical protein P7I08_02345 [Lactococcus lactis]|uniref:hypothetical protein n=1 Tax=Lactococcus lactis TaxID=1358 RepID=UPI002890D23C|nr:hypothetical protein [Lactococcus lactis]MDT2934093.1 hypothetical protein [Lactococcus lactis]
MTETAKERFYREELESIKLDLLEARPVSPSNIAKALIEADELPVTTDKLSVEKLQEHLLPYSKEMVQKIIDEKMQLVTADEFLKLHKEYLTAVRDNDKLQEQLDTAKKALEDIRTNTPIQELLNLPYGCACHEIASEALAAIGGNDD